MLQNSRRGAQIKGSRQTDAAADSNLLLDSLRNEVSILSRKLGSKTEALAIMAKELDQCRLDRDQFRAMLEQLRDSHKVGSSWSLVASDAGLRHQLALSRQRCTDLQQTNTDLTQKMEEVCGDMMVLRRDAVRQRCPVGADPDPPAEHKRDMVQKLEQLQNQCDQLRRDLEQMLDEKEELVTQRDAYKGKTHRLNHQLKVALRAPAGTTLDIDSLVTENRYLREQIKTSQDEIDRLTRVCAKYKALLETRKKKGILRLGTVDSSALIVTKRQVAEMLRSTGDGQLSDTPATLSDLRSLCAALLEQLQDKCTALAHQRKANRLLAEHCSELRHQADRHGLPVQPSADLMEGYSATHIDRESELLLQAPDSDPVDGAAAASAGDSGVATSSADGSCPSSPDRTGATHGPLTNGGAQRCPAGAAGQRPQLQQTESSGSDDGPPSPADGSDDGPPSPAGGSSGSGPTSPAGAGRQRRPPDSGGAGRTPRSVSPPAEEEILSIQQLDRYVRCLRQDGGVRPARVLCETPAQPGSQVVSSPSRTAPPPQPGSQLVNSPSRAAPQAQPGSQLVNSPSRTAPPAQPGSQVVNSPSHTAPPAQPDVEAVRSPTQPGVQGVRSPTQPGVQGVRSPTQPGVQGVRSPIQPGVQGVRSPTQPGVQGVRSPTQPDVQVLNSPSRTAPPTRLDSTELPAELDLLYRRALDELRAGEQTT